MSDPVLHAQPLDFVWATLDPFLFCVHHDDAYPAGNGQMGPNASLAGRNLGQDFAGIDGWRMYHGRQVPGFPAHPHRGFETVTIARRGTIDHSDSLGAAARFSTGDVQWMTAGEGIVHSEMFPLQKTTAANPLELFQIWVNLPARSKMVPPHFKMLWAERVPTVQSKDAAGRKTTITLTAGELDGITPPAPPPHSWAADPSSEVAIWSIRMEADATWTLPAGPASANRMLYLFRGAGTQVGERQWAPSTGLRLKPDADLSLHASAKGAELLLLQGRPIGEPVAQHGPFVMNTRAEIQQAFSDYQRTRFGGWPWPSEAPVHPADKGRFARHPDGRLDQPE